MGAGIYSRNGLKIGWTSCIAAKDAGSHDGNILNISIFIGLRQWLPDRRRQRLKKRKGIFQC